MYKLVYNYVIRNILGMNFINSLKEVIRHPVLSFDRSFSERGTRQLIWLTGAVVAIFSLLFVISMFIPFEEIQEGDQEMGRFLRLVTLFIDPGAIEKLKESTHVFGIVVAVCGLLMMTGMFISVLTNMLDVRVDRVRNGETRYKLNDHVVIIGMDSLVPSLVEQICKSDKFSGSYVLVQSTMDAEEVRSRIHNVLDKDAEPRVVIYRGKRNSKEDLGKLHIDRAKSVFIVGESEEDDRDSLNLEAMRIVAELCGDNRKERADRPLPVAVQFEYQTTFSAFQVTDLAGQWRKYIDFYPFNFYESWAKKVFVSHCYMHDNARIEYPLPDREPITYDSDKTVHLVILGMSRMGVALGTFAAQLLHFPNFCRDHSKKSRITFVDAHADREMDFFRNRYRGLFEISPAIYKDFSQDGRPTESVLPPTYFTGSDADFLDVEFEFIKGNAESSSIQDYLRETAVDEHCLTTVFVCLKEPSLNMVVGLSLPDEVYDRAIPVFVRLKSSEALLTLLNQSGNDGRYSRYSHLYPFGMLENCYDLDYDKLELAQWINYCYASPSETDTPQSLWRQLPVALQWSNFYTAYSRDFKLRSFRGILRHGMSETDIERLCMVEHNRWCMEKLLLGFRKPHKDEQVLIDRGGTVRDGDKEIKVARWYKNHYVHTDLVPNEQLEKEAITHDRDVIIGMLDRP